ncbi:MAG: PDZ domain-containing protein [Phototrophicaceae bacterium]
MLHKLSSLFWALACLLVVASATAQEETPPYLGIGLQPDGQVGIMVDNVYPDSPAEQAGLQIGDVIYTLNGEPVLPMTIGEQISQMQVGEVIQLGVVRQGEGLTVEVTLSARPTDFGAVVPTPESLEDVVVQAPRPRLGLAVVPSDDPVGVRVIDFGTDSPAQLAGVQLEDVITSINGITVTGPADLQEALEGLAVGDRVTLAIIRAGETLEVEVELGESEAILRFDNLTPDQVQAFGLVFSDGRLLVEAPQDPAYLESVGLQVGDEITALNGQALDTPNLAFDSITQTMQTDTLILTVQREGETVDITLTLQQSLPILMVLSSN